MAINSNSTLINQYIPDFRLSKLTDGEVLVYDSLRNAFVNTSGASSKGLRIGHQNIIKYSIDYDHFAASQKGPPVRKPRILMADENDETSWQTVLDGTDVYSLNINDLVDVDAESPNIGNILTYDGNNWLASPLLLNLASDVTVTAPEAGHSLIHDGVKWTNGTLSLTNLSDVVDTWAPEANGVMVYDGTNSVWDTKVLELNDLSNVSIDSPVNNNVIGYDEVLGTWVPIDTKDIPISLTEITDVTLIGATEDQALIYKSGEWTNSDIEWDSVKNKPLTYIPEEHQHTASQIVGLTDEIVATNTSLQFKLLDDVNDTTRPNTYLQWDDSGVNINYVDSIPAADVTGLATVATSGDYSDLVGTPIAGVDFAEVVHTHTIADITDFDDSNYATSEQGDLADSAVQPGENISLLVNDANYLTDITSKTLDELSDVSSQAPNVNDYLLWDGNSWIPSTPDNTVSLTLNELTDVAVGSATNTQVLTHNNGMWINTTIQYSDIDGLDDVFAFKDHTHTTDEVIGLDAYVSSYNTQFEFKQLSDVTATPVSNGFLQWNTAADTIVYSTTIPSASITGLSTVATSGNYNDLNGIPTEFTASAHTHTFDDIPGLQPALDLKVNSADLSVVATTGYYSDLLNKPVAGIDFADASHIHPVSQIEGLELNVLNDVNLTSISSQEVLTFDGTEWVNSAINWIDIEGTPTEFVPSNHSHTTDDITGLEEYVDSRNQYFNFKSLTDVGVPVDGGILVWDNTNSQISYSTTLDVSQLSGLSAVATSGSYIDLTDTPELPSNDTFNIVGLSDTSATSVPDGYFKWNSGGDLVTYTTIPSSDVVGLADVATSGSYSDLSDTPHIPTNTDFNFVDLADATSTSIPDGIVRWNSLGDTLIYQDKLTVGDISDISPVAISNNYNDLDNVPTTYAWQNIINVPTEFTPSEHTHDISDITDLQLILDSKLDSANEFSGDYNDLSNTPTIPTNTSFTFIDLADTNETPVPNGFLQWNSSGSQVKYTDTISVTNIAGLNNVALTGSYADLTNVPTEFTPETHSHSTSQITGIEEYALKTNISVAGFTGDYNDLSNTPYIPTNNDLSFINLSDTDATSVNNGFVRWNDSGTLLQYQESIDSSDVTGLADVATTGSFNDLLEVNATPQEVGQVLTWDGTDWVASSSVESVLDLSDIQDTPVTNAYLRWDTNANMVIFEQNINASNITGLSPVATTSNIFDLRNVVGEDTITAGQVLKWDGEKFIPGTVSSSGGGGNGSSTLLGLDDTAIDVGEVGQVLTVSVVDANNSNMPAVWKNQFIDYNTIVNAPANSDWTLTNLGDTEDVAVPNAFLQWNVLGDTVSYVTSIPAQSISGLSDVALSGDYEDLDNRVEYITDLEDVDTLTLPANGNVLIWNSNTNQWSPGEVSGTGNSGFTNKIIDDDEDTYIDVSAIDDAIVVQAGPDNGNIYLRADTTNNPDAGVVVSAGNDSEPGYIDSTELVLETTVGDLSLNPLTGVININSDVDSQITSPQNLDINSAANLSLQGSVWPSVDGTSGQVLTTDGNNILSWEDPTGGSSGFVNKIVDDDEDTYINVSEIDDAIIIQAGPDDGNIYLRPNNNINSDVAVVVGEPGADGFIEADVLTLETLSGGITIKPKSGSIVLDAESSIELRSDSGLSIASEGALILKDLQWPDGSGNPDQVLTTDGFGTLSWTDQSSGFTNKIIDDDEDTYIDVNEIDDAVVIQAGPDDGNIHLRTNNTNNPVAAVTVGGPGDTGIIQADELLVSSTVGGLQIAATSGLFLQQSTWPAGRGDDGQILITDGDGVLSFVDPDLLVTSPLTTKGDILTRDNTDEQRLQVGEDGQVLTADSSHPTGIKWVTPTTTVVGTLASIDMGTFAQPNGSIDAGGFV